MSEKSLSIVSPVNGKAILLENVPDDVFSQKILGDGCAVIPSDGSFVCPVDGEVVSVADSLHAIGFVTEDDVELLTSPADLATYKAAIMEALYKGTKRNIISEDDPKNAVVE